MKLIIKNDNRDIVKNPNVKIIETTEASFTNQTVFIEENDVPIIKYTDTESMYFIKDLDNLYDRKSKSEVLLDITIDNLEAISGGGSSEPVDSRPYKVYTALLTQSVKNDPVATVLENTLNGNVTFSFISNGIFEITIPVQVNYNKVFILCPSSFKNKNAGVFLDVLIDLPITTNNFKINVKELNFATNYLNSMLDKFPIEIRVYN